MKRFILSIVVQIFFLPAIIYAQQKISGTVYDENKQPLIGASVRLAGTTTATITNIDGKFDLSVNTEKPVLQISFIGYLTEEIDVSGKTSIEVNLKPDLTTLEDVVVIGYGSTKKADLTSSIATVKSEELAKLPVTSLSQTLQGKAAGVTVVQSGSPGGGATIRIRGTNSPNRTDPLWVVDGIIGASEPSANDIESMQILKDAAACAIYGSRGSNGVIIVTTKKGSSGGPKINFKSYYGYQQLDNKIDMMSGDEYIQYWENNKKVNDFVGPNGEKYPNGLSRPARVDSALVNPAMYNANTNWLDEIYRSGNMNNINISISNGNDKGNYFVSLDKLKQEGVQIGSGYNRLSLQINSEVKKGVFKLGENTNIKREEWGNNGSRLQGALRQSPLLSVRNPNPPKIGIVQWPGNTPLDNSNNGNPVASIENSYNKDLYQSIESSIFGEIEPVSGLVLRSTYAVKAGNSNNQSKGFKYLDGSTAGQVTDVSMSMGTSYSINTQFENTLTFKKEFDVHSIEAMVGYTKENSTGRNMNANVTGFNVNNPESFASAQPTGSKFIGGWFGESSLESFLGRFMYNYNGKYYVTGNFRADGTSRFLKGHKYSQFPSMSLGWRISEEEFMKSFTQISNLKLRGSYGTIGSQFGIRELNARLLSTSANYVFGNALQQGISSANVIDESLTWETSYNANVGLDLDLFNNTLSFTFDYFNKNTKNLLFNTPVALSSGLKDPNVYRNAGEALNTGFEITATLRETTGEFNHEVNLTFTQENTKVTQLIKDNFISGSTQFYNMGLTNTAVGHGIGDFYGYVFDGIYQIGDKDIPSYLQAGDVRYKDLDDDGKITSNDRTYLGKPVPDFTFSLTYNVTWKNLDASIFLIGVQGNQIFNHNRYHTEILAKGFNQSKKALEAWTPENPSTTIPRYTDQHTNNYALPSSRFIEDGSYLRIQNITIGYLLPKSLLSKVKIDKLRFYISAQNLMTFTKYSGFDPEVSGSAPSWDDYKNLYRGIDNNSYPLARTYVAGLELSF